MSSRCKIEALIIRKQNADIKEIMNNKVDYISVSEHLGRRITNFNKQYEIRSFGQQLKPVLSLGHL